MAATQLATAREMLTPLPTPLRDRWPRAAPPAAVGTEPLHQPRRRAPLRIAYVGSLSDEPQMRAMSALFRQVRNLPPPPCSRDLP